MLPSKGLLICTTYFFTKGKQLNIWLEVRHVFLSDKGGYLTAVRSGPARLSYWLGVDNRVTVDVDVKPVARYGHYHRF